MSSFNWQCKFCSRHATITSERVSKQDHSFDLNNDAGPLVVRTVVVVCPNENCKKVDLACSLYTGKQRVHSYMIEAYGNPKKIWQLIPDSNAKPFPSYIPSPILDDYKEACLIVNLSPKASATLSRRCLQGMIRDFWKIRKSRLVDEIDELKGKVEAQTWKAIDSVRKLGNIGAHMEEDINLVIEVDPNEATLLVHLIEILLSDWYVARNTREDNLNRIIEVAKAKDAKKEKSSGQT